MVIGKVMVGVMLATWVTAGTLAAQSFKGSGPDATRTFPLAEGTAVIEFEHQGAGTFVVRMLDEAGNAIDDVAGGSGTFGGSKAIRVPRSGLYLFKVEAPGQWTVRVVSIDLADTESTRSGAQRGRSDADEPGNLGWLGRGFAGGLLGGPIGTSIVISRAARSAGLYADSAAATRPADDLAWTAAYRDAFANRLRSRRQRSAVIGGVVGTGLFVYTLVKVIDLHGGGPGDGPGGGDGGVPFLIVPIRF